MLPEADDHLELRGPKGKVLAVKLWENDLGLSGTDFKKRIPYYNILWASVADNTLSVDYVTDPAKNPVKLQHAWFLYGDEEQTARAETVTAEIQHRAYRLGQSKPRKSAYVLINPNSGPGGAFEKWEKEAKPLFEAAKMQLDVVTLTRGGEATELVAKMDINKYDIVVACSGDGTPHEIFNGLAQRPDARLALSKIAVAHLPCGSGNALALNLYGSNKLGPAAVGVIKGIVAPIDMTSITQGSTRLMSVVSQSVGIIAECDLGTEHLRWMGAKRFEWGLLTRVAQRKTYPCDILAKVEHPDKESVKKHYRSIIGVHGQHNGAINREDNVDEDNQGLPPLTYGTIQDDKTSLEGWETIPGDKVGNFYSGNIAYMSPDANFFPGALPSDGCLDLVVVNGDISAVKATRTLLAVESGKHFEMPHVMYKKISAYRITPRDQKDGFISIDGEKVPFQPFQAEVHTGLGRVIAKEAKFQAAGPRGWESA